MQQVHVVAAGAQLLLVEAASLRSPAHSPRQPCKQNGSIGKTETDDKSLALRCSRPAVALPGPGLGPPCSRRRQGEDPLRSTTRYGATWPEVVVRCLLSDLAVGMLLLPRLPPTTAKEESTPPSRFRPPRRDGSRGAVQRPPRQQLSLVARNGDGTGWRS